MKLEIPNPNGLPPEGPKQNPTPPGTPTPKPEIKTTKPEIAAPMPDPMPLNLQALTEVDNWVKARAPAQNSAQQEFVELSTEHRQFRFEQIDRLRATKYEGAPAVIFNYQDRTTLQVQVVIIKLDLRDDAIMLERAIAWRRIQVFNCGQYIQGTDADLSDNSPFDPAQCVDHYFRQQWIAGAKAKLAADRAAIAQPLAKANQRIAELDERIRLDECQRNATFATLIASETKLKQEHDRAEFLNRLAHGFAGIIVIIVIIIFVVYVWRA
jgi:hypothetical protein